MTNFTITPTAVTNGPTITIDDLHYNNALACYKDNDKGMFAKLIFDNPTSVVKIEITRKEAQRLVTILNRILERQNKEIKDGTLTHIEG